MLSSIRVLVVDDSALIRQILTRALTVDPRVDVVGTAKTGVEAVEKARLLSPDVVTLDIEMPEMTGLEALPHLHRISPARVVMLSSLDDPDTTYRALELGAVDFIPKPTAGMASSITELSEQLLKTIKTAYRVKPGATSAGLLGEEGLASDGAEHHDAFDHGGPVAYVGLAASTGGPPALERVFSGLTASLPAAYLVVQHLPAGFSASLARRLGSVTDVQFVEAEHGMRIMSGHAYLAPHGVHMTVHRTAGGHPEIQFNLADPMHGVRPSADPLFESLAKTFGAGALGVVLTGMGTDGAEGCVAIRRAGGETIVQDEASSVVWGMPGAAVRLAAAGRVVPGGLVAAEIRRSIRVRAEAGV